MDKEDRQLWRKVLQTVRSVRPFPITAPKTKLLVGVSGGVDSLALLHLLWRRLGATRLVVAHLNHGLRSEADDDAQFVVDTAVAWQIPFVTKKVDVAHFSGQERLSLEAAGRQARYLFLAEQAVEVGATAVAVAHHADDQAETVLLHLLRGSGSAGLRGMLPVTILPGATNLPLVRPLLNTPRTEIEAYCARHGLKPRHDSSNADTQFARNRIRHELLPLLQTYNPQIAARLQQLATITADEQAVLMAHFETIFPSVVTGQGAAWLTVHRAEFRMLSAAWQRLVLRRVVQLLRPLHSEISFQTIEQARTLILTNASGGQATLPGQLVMQVEATEIFFGEASQEQPLRVPQLISESVVPLAVPGEVALAGGWQMTAVAQPNASLKMIRQNKDRWQAFIAMREDESLWLRPSLPDERFQPLGMSGHSQKIQDLLSDHKVGRGKRPLWPIVATASNPAWIVGQQLDERLRVAEDSDYIVQLNCTRQD